MARNKKKNRSARGGVEEPHSGNDEAHEDEAAALPTDDQVAPLAAAACTTEAETTNGGVYDASPDAPAASADVQSGPVKLHPVEVLYCPNCTFPAEMCEFSGMYEKCQPWLREHAAELAEAVERGRKRRVLTEKGRLEARIEGRGGKKALERIIVLETMKVRTSINTFVTGMDLFGFNLKDLSREWRKRFSCGAGVRDPEVGKEQCAIQIQGNVEETLANMLVDKYKIPKGSIYKYVGKKKAPYF